MFSDVPISVTAHRGHCNFGCEWRLRRKRGVRGRLSLPWVVGYYLALEYTYRQLSVKSRACFDLCVLKDWAVGMWWWRLRLGMEASWLSDNNSASLFGRSSSNPVGSSLTLQQGSKRTRKKQELQGTIPACLPVQIFQSQYQQLESCLRHLLHHLKEERARGVFIPGPTAAW